MKHTAAEARNLANFLCLGAPELPQLVIVVIVTTHITLPFVFKQSSVLDVHKEL